jgi:hypothetical protein
MSLCIHSLYMSLCISYGSGLLKAGGLGEGFSCWLLAGLWLHLEPFLLGPATHLHSYPP